MKDRNRAWRRRKARNVMAKVKATKEWIVRQFKDPKAKPIKALKQHRAGALTHAQDLRLEWSTEQELRQELREAA